eukprot:COSAG06_NODE_48156_length_334_cov_0.676596_1_plen_60_part_10
MLSGLSVGVLELHLRALCDQTAEALQLLLRTHRLPAGGARAATATGARRHLHQRGPLLVL